MMHSCKKKEMQRTPTFNIEAKFDDKSIRNVTETVMITLTDDKLFAKMK